MEEVMIAKRGITKDSLTNSYNEGKDRRRDLFGCMNLQFNQYISPKKVKTICMYKNIL